MATYVNDLRLKEIGTGESSGTWGTETNTNLELIGDALGFGTEGITTNADTHTTTVADGSVDAGRAMYIKYTGTLDSACTVTIGPNTINRMHFIENATTGSQNLVISQGTGSNVTIPAGDVKAVYLDGAGSGAAVADAFTDLNLAGTTTVDALNVSGALTGSSTIQGTTITATTAFVPDASDGAALGTSSLEFSDLFLADAAVINLGDDQDTTLTHVADTGILLNSTRQLQFGDSGTYIHQSADGVLDLVSDTEIEINATTIDMNGDLDLSGTLNSMTIANSGLTGPSSQNFAINTPNSFRVNIDSDNNGSSEVFVVGHGQTAVDNSNNVLFGITESGVATLNGTLEITTTDNSNTLTLVSTDADSAVGPVLDLYRNSGSPADDDFLGKINFRGRNDNSQDVNYGFLAYFIADASDGTEDAFMQMGLMKGGSSHLLMEATSTETVFNQGSVDQDFRVESNGETHAIFVDAGNNEIGLFTSAPNGLLHIGDSNAEGDTTNPAIQIGGASTYRMGMYTSSEGAVIENKNGDDGIQFRVKTAGEAMRIDGGTGNVLIGTTTATEKLTLNGAIAITGSLADDRTSTAAIDFSSGVSRIVSYGASGTAGITAFRTASGGASSSELMRILGTGEVHITSGGDAITPTIKHGGATGDVAKLRLINRSGQGANKGGLVELGAVTDDGVSRSDVFASVAGLKTNGTSANREGYLQFSTSSGSALTERMRINSSGNLLINTTSDLDSGSHLQVLGSTGGGRSPVVFQNSVDAGPALSCWKTPTTTDSTARFIQFYANSDNTPMGGIVGNGASNVQFATLSDEREKENIIPVDNVLEKLMNLDIVSFDWKKHDEHIEAGFIAQNVEKHFPEYVIENISQEGEEARKGTTGGMSAGYIAVLTKAIQEQQEQIDALQSEIKTLKGE